ncbi:MAG: hypothetical protein JNM41_04700 [Flavipsychrobacter sp.]|nr:hypothetical protein [Flavipsychrobacter sp.]
MKTNIPEHLPPGVAYASSGNSCTENYSFIGNGRLNCANGSASFIGNGAINQVDAGTNNSFIGNGTRHQIVGGAHNSFVGSGDCNIIQSLSANSVIGGGEQNTIGNSAVGSLDALYSFVGGGFCNTIDTGTAPGTESRLNVIGGGSNNLICAGACNSAIIGGEGNIVTHNWATVAGCNVATAYDCAFHVNQVVAANTQPYAALGNGIMQYLVPTPALIAAGIPLGSCIVLIN